MTGPIDADIGYEQARDELADVVRKLEAGGLGLEESLALWERGETLARLCDRHLAGARERIDTALADADTPSGSAGSGGASGSAGPAGPTTNGDRRR